MTNLTFRLEGVGIGKSLKGCWFCRENEGIGTMGTLFQANRGRGHRGGNRAVGLMD